MLKRLEDLDILSDDQAERLRINYARRGWRRGEPGDEDVLVEQPTLLPAALGQLAQHFDLPTFASQFPVAPEEAAQMLGVPEPLLTGEGRISQFVPRQTASDDTDATDGPAEIVSLSKLRREKPGGDT